MDIQWTDNTYRIDEITRKFVLPVVIRMTEGFYSSNSDTEVFSAGDIMTIDKELILHKVAANFAANSDASCHKKSNNRHEIKANLESKEILIPLNYKGKLKVKSEIKVYETVRELSLDFPKYVKLCENLSVKTEHGASIDVQSGSIVELDRVIPGTLDDSTSQPESLVLEFKQDGKSVVVAIPTSSCGKFRTESDDNEYTIKEAIDKFCIAIRWQVARKCFTQQGRI